MILQEGLPYVVLANGKSLFGFFSPEPSADGLAMAGFPGLGTVEIAGMLYEDIPQVLDDEAEDGQQMFKRPAARKRPTTRKRPAAATEPAGEAKKAKDIEDSCQSRFLGQGSDELLEEEQEDQEEEEKEEDNQAQDANKVLRPLQLWLQTRDAAQSSTDRHAEWKLKTRQEKKLYAASTQMERGVK